MVLGWYRGLRRGQIRTRPILTIAVTLPYCLINGYDKDMSRDTTLWPAAHLVIVMPLSVLADTVICAVKGVDLTPAASSTIRTSNQYLSHQDAGYVA